jgi:hypothetical protein
MVLMSLTSGALVSLIGYYTPFLMTGGVLISVGAGLMSTFEIDTGSSKWIGCQIAFGAGLGFAMQQPILAMQASLPKADIPVGTAIIFFSQSLGGAIFLTIAQNIFHRQLISRLSAADIPGLAGSTVSSVGVTEIKGLVSAQYLPTLLTAYNRSIMDTFYIATGLAGIAVLGSLFVEWNSVKDKDLLATAA